MKTEGSFNLLVEQQAGHEGQRNPSRIVQAKSSWKKEKGREVKKDSILAYNRVDAAKQNERKQVDPQENKRRPVLLLHAFLLAWNQNRYFSQLIKA